MDYLDYQGLQRYHQLLSDQIGNKANKVKIGANGTEYTSSNGVITIPAYDYSGINYTVNTTTANGNYANAVTIDGSLPVHVIALTGAVTSLTLSTNPTAGHSTHIFFTNSTASDISISIAHDATSRVCPGAEALDLTAVAGGYVEVDFLNANNKIYVRGV